MQEQRRRADGVQSLDLTKEKIQVPAHYWKDLEEKDGAALCSNALSTISSQGDIVLPVLGREILVDRRKHSLRRKKVEGWEPVTHPLFELLVLVYLLRAGPQPLSRELVGSKDLTTAHFFQGPHELNFSGVLERFGRDVKGLRKAAESLGGKRQSFADAAFRIPAFPKVPLYYLLWEGDDEFEPRISVLFDRSIGNHLSADAIWGLVALVSDALLKTPNLPF